MAINEAEVEVQEPEPDSESEVEPEAYVCQVCGRAFPSARSRGMHQRAHKQVAPVPPSGRRGRKAGRTQQGLTLAYGLAAMAFGAFGPPPAEARQRVAVSASLTARQAGAALDRGLRKTPLYPLISAVFGLGAFLDDLAPAALPLVVGMYNYAPPAAQERVRPMARMLAGQVLHQAFGDTPPAEPTEVMPVALPAWIQQFTNDLFPEPSLQVQTNAAAA